MKRNNTRVLLALSFFCFVGISKAVETEGLVSFQSGNLPILDPFSHAGSVLARGASHYGLPPMPWQFWLPCAHFSMASAMPAYCLAV